MPLVAGRVWPDPPMIVIWTGSLRRNRAGSYTPLLGSPLTHSPSLSNSDQTTVGLLAILVYTGTIEEGTAGSIGTVRQRPPHRSIYFETVSNCDQIS